MIYLSHKRPLFETKASGFMAFAFIPIYYSGFWDMPHALLTVFDDKLYYFQRGYFHEELGDYPPKY